MIVIPDVFQYDLKCVFGFHAFKNDLIDKPNLFNISFIICLTFVILPSFIYNGKTNCSKSESCVCLKLFNMN